MPYSTKEKRREHRQRNKDQFNAKKSEYMIKFRAEHPDYQKNYAKQHYETNKKDYIVRAQKQKANARKDEQKFLRMMLSRVKHRAKKRGIPFNLSLDDLKIPEVCPVFGIPLEFGAKIKGTFLPSPNSPSVDKFIPALGYIPSNIQVISHRANVLKRDGTLEEFKCLIRWMEKNNT